jgi:capsular exopolysaccharide synthesis family protein
MIPAETLQATTLAAAAPERRLVALGAPESAAAEQYRVLHQRLVRMAARRPMRLVAVTSSGQREGRTTTAANLAFTAAQEGRAVLLVEADLRRPALAALLDLAPRAGLVDVLDGRAELAQAVARVGPLSVLCAGEVADAAASSRSPRIPALVEQLRAAYDLVVLDAPPAMSFAGGDRLASAADAVVLVVRAGVTPRQVTRFALDALGDRAVGVVLNDVAAETVAHGRGLFAGAAEPPETASRRAG